MSRALKCLKTTGGIIALIDLNDSDFLEITEVDISILLCNVGLLVKIKDVEILIPDECIEFLCENRVISLYPFKLENYIENPVLTVELSKESVIKAKGIYDFWKDNLN